MKKANVILMLVDDLGYGDISAFNKNSKIHTPNIDALAAGGMSFTDSHACSSLCTPSRYGLLTGRYNWRSKLKFLVLPGDSDPLIEKERMTMAHLFKQAGYHTACVGKWHLGLEWQLNPNPKPEDFGEEAGYYEKFYARKDREPAVRPGSKEFHECGMDIDYSKPITFGPNQYGFDYFYGLPGSLDQSPFVYIENDKVIELPTQMTGVYPLDRSNATMQQLWERGPIAPSFCHEEVLDDMNDKVLDLIDEYSESDKPFFLYYPTPAVHGPLLPNQKFKGASGLNLYADVVLQVDDMVRQITEKLKEKGMFEDTIFIFTSDNGCSGVADYPFLLEHGHNPSYIFKGKKSDIYEGGHRVPTIVHYPKLVQAGTVTEKNVCHTDFFNTFAELLEISLPDNVAEDSISNLPLWKQESKEVRKATVYSCASGYLGVVKGKWKLALCENGGCTPRVMASAFKNEEIEQHFELYDMEQDIEETTNVIGQHPDIVKELIEELSTVYYNGRTTKGKKQENFIPKIPWVQINWL